LENALKHASNKNLQAKRSQSIDVTMKAKNPLQLEEELVSKKYKDDWGLKATDDKFVDNTFWKLPSQYQIDDLLGE
jgi:hypothetical protein